MQGAAAKTAASHSAIFLMLSGVGCLGTLPYFGAEHQISIHRLMKLFLQALHAVGLEVYQILLTGDYGGFRECHITPDWLLVYQYREQELLLLLSRTGTHSDLF